MAVINKARTLDTSSDPFSGLISDVELARRMGISRKTLWAYRRNGQMPMGRKFGRSRYYDLSVLKEWAISRCRDG